MKILERQKISEARPDWIPFEPMIQESKSPAGLMVVRGILQKAEAENHNGRVYPRSTLEREIERYKKECVQERCALGAVDHPDSDEVKLENASHNVIDIWWDGNTVMGDVEILTTPAGNILQTLYENRIKLGISSRGTGTLTRRQDGTSIVEEDFRLAAFDFVSNPSTKGAFMKPLQESQQSSPLKREQRIESRLDEIIRNMSSL